MLCQQAGALEAERKHCQNSWPEPARGIFHTKEHHTQYINEEWGAADRCWGTGWALVSGWRETLYGALPCLS